MSQPPLNAAIGYLFRPMVPAAFTHSLLNLLAAVPEPEHLGNRVQPVGCHLYPSEGRNALIAELLRVFPACERFLLLDDDMVFEPWQAVALLARCTAEQPVVSGIYHAWDGRAQVVVPGSGVHGRARPLVLVKRGESPEDTRCVTRWEFPERELLEVDVVGMGFVAVHRSLLEQLGPDQFDHLRHHDGGFMPEDASWCSRVQAAGHKIIVHTGVRVGHMKLVEIGERAEVSR